MLPYISGQLLELVKESLLMSRLRHTEADPYLIPRANLNRIAPTQVNLGAKLSEKAPESWDL